MLDPFDVPPPEVVALYQAGRGVLEARQHLIDVTSAGEGEMTKQGALTAACTRRIALGMRPAVERLVAAEQVYLAAQDAFRVSCERAGVGD